VSWVSLHGSAPDRSVEYHVADTYINKGQFSLFILLHYYDDCVISPRFGFPNPRDGVAIDRRPNQKKQATTTIFILALSPHSLPPSPFPMRGWSVVRFRLFAVFFSVFCVGGVPRRWRRRRRRSSPSWRHGRLRRHRRRRRRHLLPPVSLDVRGGNILSRK